MLPEALPVAISAEQPKRRARQHGAVKRFVPLPQLRPFLPREAAAVLHLVQLLRNELLDPTGRLKKP